MRPGVGAFGFGLVVIAAALCVAAGASLAQSNFAQSDASTCKREEFAALVDKAGAALRALNAVNTPYFQAELRKLKVRNGWNDQEFIERARHFVENPEIAAYDESIELLISKINSVGRGGGAGVSADAADCRLRDELQAHLDNLVATMKAKWSHMFARVTEALEE